MKRRFLKNSTESQFDLERFFATVKYFQISEGVFYLFKDCHQCKRDCIYMWLRDYEFRFLVDSRSSMFETNPINTRYILTINVSFRIKRIWIYILRYEFDFSFRISNVIKQINIINNNKLSVCNLRKFYFIQIRSFAGGSANCHMGSSQFRFDKKTG